MKTNLLILAAIGLMMQGCVTFHNEKFNRSLDANPVVDINAPCKVSSLSDKQKADCVQKINETQVQGDVVSYFKWCNANPEECQSLKDFSEAWRKITDAE